MRGWIYRKKNLLIQEGNLVQQILVFINIAFTVCTVQYEIAAEKVVQTVTATKRES